MCNPKPGLKENEMNTTMAIDLNIGADVHCRDDKCGKLTKVVIDPDTMQVKSIVVEEGLLLKRARVLPIDTVTSTGDETIYLSLSSDELTTYPDYKETEFEQPLSKWKGYSDHQVKNVLFPVYGLVASASVPIVTEKLHEGVPDGLEVIQHGASVRNHDDALGTLENLLVDKQSEMITHLIVKRGIVRTDLVVVPLHFVSSLIEDEIYVTMTTEAFEKLPDISAAVD